MPEGDADQEFLRQFLAHRDALCPNCQYNLRALTGGICPECGERIVVRVTMAEPKQGAPITGLIGLSAGAGFNGLLLIYLLIMVAQRIGPPPNLWTGFVLMNGSGLIVIGACVAMWLRKWRAIRRQSAAVRWSLVRVCWMLTLVDIVIFSFTIQ